MGRPRCARRRDPAPVRAERRGPRDARGGADPPARTRRSLRRTAARHLRPRRLRAVRLPRRDLAAVRRGARQVRPARADGPSRRVPARLRERVRPHDRRAAAPQRQLPRLPPAEPGRRRVLALRRRSNAAPRREQRPGRAASARREDGRPVAERRPARARARRGRPEPRRGERLRLPRGRPPRRPLSGRLAHPPFEPARLARPETGKLTVARDQPAPPDRAARPRVRAAAAARGGPDGGRLGRARPPLHLPQRQHRAAVRVRQPHLAEQPQVRRARRRRRPVLRTGLLHDPDRRRPRARDARAPVRVRQGRRLLLPPRTRGAPLPRERSENVSSPVGS